MPLQKGRGASSIDDAINAGKLIYRYNWKVKFVGVIHLVDAKGKYGELMVMPTAEMSLKVVAVDAPVGTLGVCGRRMVMNTVRLRKIPTLLPKQRLDRSRWPRRKMVAPVI